MTEKLPHPCEARGATGLNNGCECRECRGKGYQLFFPGVDLRENGVKPWP
jgi:hypothetical protein